MMGERPSEHLALDERNRIIPTEEYRDKLPTLADLLRSALLTAQEPSDER